MSPVLTIARDADVHVCTLNQPTRGNTLSALVVDALTQALDAFEGTGGRVLVLRSEGRHFCTGFDLSDVEATTEGDLLLRFVRIEQLLARLARAPYATIAVAQGRAIGAGADLFAACQRRIALDDATFRFPGAGFGLVLGTRRLGARMSAAVAAHTVMSGALIDADTALRLGLATARAAPSDVQALLQDEIAAATRLDRPTTAAILAVLADSSAQQDTDLAMLVRSAARPGLRERIIAYRAEALAKS